jgi:hypothetical protein
MLTFREVQTSEKQSHRRATGFANDRSRFTETNPPSGACDRTKITKRSQMIEVNQRISYPTPAETRCRPVHMCENKATNGNPDATRVTIARDEKA